VSKIEYSISFVIPTRNRSEFIEPLINRCLEIAGSKIIISDNSDFKVLDKLIQNYKSDRICYNYYSEKLSVIDNFNLALGFVKTDFVCFLGDDDMIGPGFEKALEIMSKHNIDILNVDSCSKPLQYFWPGNPSKRWGDLGGKLYFSSYTGNFRKLNLTKAAKAVRSNLGLGPLTLPRLYLGVVRMSFVNLIINKQGKIFGGYSPDIYSSYSLTLENPNFFLIDYPIIIPGACSKSTSSARASRSDVGELLDNDHLGRFENVKWDVRIPAFYSPYNVWAATLLIAVESNNHNLSSFNFAHLYALNLLNSNFSFNKINIAIESLSKKYILLKAWIILLIQIQLIKLTISKFLQVFKYFGKNRPGGADFETENNSTSYDAFSSIEYFLRNNNIQIKFNK
jgi:glycosyltransferase involved in cell wall biosynthesis